MKDLKKGKVNLDDPATTLALLKLDAVVGVKGFFNQDGSLRSMGISCAICHSTVDDSFAPGIGKRLDGWANRDLNVGAIVGLAPNLKPVADLLEWMGDGARCAPKLGAGQIRCGIVPGRQSVPARSGNRPQR